MTPFLGQLLLVPYSYAPRGWALCAGQLLPINQNVALFSVLGTTYGGDGQVTFALPDLRGRAANSLGQGGGLQNYVLGQVLGSETVALNVNQMPQHQHTLGITTGGASGTAPAGALLADTGGSPNIYVPNANPAGALDPSAVSTVGGNRTHSNQSPCLVMNWIIAMQGIFPSRN